VLTAGKEKGMEEYLKYDNQYLMIYTNEPCGITRIQNPESRIQNPRIQNLSIQHPV
jgi:hypothetical protein